jgi:hypothetical protein
LGIAKVVTPTILSRKIVVHSRYDVTTSKLWGLASKTEPFCLISPISLLGLHSNATFTQAWMHAHVRTRNTQAIFLSGFTDIYSITPSRQFY